MGDTRSALIYGHRYVRTCVCSVCVCVCVCVSVSAPTTQTYVIVYVPKYLNNQKIFFLQVAVSTSILIFTSVTVREKRFQALCVLVFDFDFFAYDNDSRKFLVRE